MDRAKQTSQPTTTEKTESAAGPDSCYSGYLEAIRTSFYPSQMEKKRLDISKMELDTADKIKKELSESYQHLAQIDVFFNEAMILGLKDSIPYIEALDLGVSGGQGGRLLEAYRRFGQEKVVEGRLLKIGGDEVGSEGFPLLDQVADRINRLETFTLPLIAREKNLFLFDQIYCHFIYLKVYKRALEGAKLLKQEGSEEDETKMEVAKIWFQAEKCIDNMKKLPSSYTPSGLLKRNYALPVVMREWYTSASGALKNRLSSIKTSLNSNEPNETKILPIEDSFGYHFHVLCEVMEYIAYKINRGDQYGGISHLLLDVDEFMGPEKRKKVKKDLARWEVNRGKLRVLFRELDDLNLRATASMLEKVSGEEENLASVVDEIKSAVEDVDLFLARN